MLLGGERTGEVGGGALVWLLFGGFVPFAPSTSPPSLSVSLEKQEEKQEEISGRGWRCPVVGWWFGLEIRCRVKPSEE